MFFLGVFAGFGNSALNFQLQIWMPEEIRDRVASELRTAIGRVLGEAGIHFPQNEVHLVSVAPSLPEAARRPGSSGPGLGLRQEGMTREWPKVLLRVLPTR